MVNAVSVSPASTDAGSAAAADGVEVELKRGKQPPSMSTYMGGDVDEVNRRLRSLDAIAANLGVTRSAMLQMLADGKLLLCVPGAIVEE